MKRLIVALLAIGCVSITILGSLHWKEKTTVTTTPSIQADENSGNFKQTSQFPASSRETLIKKSSNWPEQAKENFAKSLKKKRPYVILLAGSTALGNGESGWSSIVAKNLNQTYGSEVKVEIRAYDMTSLEFLNQDKEDELAELKPDLTVLEPFTLKDNGNVRIEDTLSNISIIKSSLEKSNSDSTLILQPPHPLYQANYYPVQVQSLKQYAEDNNLTYLDHWTAWPDSNSEELKSYIEEGQDTPSSKGHALWAEYITDYLISEN
ncbi:SGNH/GDSL hydrolase family protein [Mesobacillus zeae]|nr:SGNH/GDSL hydrolase family protein [Mesobacillus zeae]